MAFTGKLGAASSRLGNIQLGHPPEAPTVVAFAAGLTFVGSNSPRSATSQTFAAGLTFAGELEIVLRGEPAVHSIGLDFVVQHVITLEAG